MKPTLLFYGNCQATALYGIFAADPVIAENYRVLHIPSFDDRVPNAERVGREAIAAATIFFDQHDRVPFPQQDLLSPECLRITFPAIDLNLLWPLDCINVFLDAPTAEFPWGRFPYGDRVIVDSVKRGASAREALKYYLESSQDHLPNLDRFEKMEYARLQARDAKCDVKLADFVIETFRDKNLFWCVNHPTILALGELSHRLIAAVGDRSPVLSRAPIDATMGAMGTLNAEEPLSLIRVPVHPSIADHFHLRWYPRDGGRHYGLRGNRLTYDDYFAQMIDDAIRVRDLAASNTVARSST